MNGGQTQRKGWLRTFASVANGAVLGVINLATLYCVTSSLTMDVADDSDKNDILEGIAVAAVVGAVLACLCVLLTILAVALRWLRWWWLLPPAIMLAIAIARFVWENVAYPVG